MTEREQFEVWAKDGGLVTSRNGKGQYNYIETDTAWDAWQARAALSTPQPAEPDRLSREGRIIMAMATDLGLINEALGLDPNDGGADPILDAIQELKDAALAAPSPAQPADDMARDASQLANWLLCTVEGNRLRFAGPPEPYIAGLSRVLMVDEHGNQWTLTAGLREGFLSDAQIMKNIRAGMDDDSSASSPEGSKPC